MAKGIEINRWDEDCALCRKADADEVGSHLAPNFIIHKAFSFDGKGKRDHEISYLTHLNNPSESTYYARGVNPVNIKADLGHEMSDEEIEENVNNLVYDHLFCKGCEKRFGKLETEYSKFYNDGKQIDPKVAYLFWLSVFWRMSVGSMAIDMGINDELNIRNILDRNITDPENAITTEENLGDYGYIIFRCRDVQKGDSGIFGTRTRSLPYVIIINDLVVALVKDNAKSHRFCYKVVKQDFVNSWNDEDIYEEEIDIETFARLKRWVIDESFRVGFGARKEKVITAAQEYCRHTGNVDDWKDFEDEIQIAASLDADDRPPMPMLKNMRRFWIAELKTYAANKIGREYDFLKDRSLLLFGFDVKNYQEGLIEYARKGQYISHLPFARKLVARKYWEDELSDPNAPEPFDYEAVIEDMFEKGYTIDDLLDRNCCDKENEHGL